MPKIIAAFYLALIGTACLAQTPQVTRADVTEFGEYTLQVQTTDQTSNNGIPQSTVTGVQLLSQTRVIHLHKDLHFGFRCTIVGEPKDADINVRMVTIYPPAGLQRHGETTPIQRDESVRERSIGDNYYRGYTINDDWMMVPGDWTFEMWYGDQKLVSQTFTMVQ